MSAVTAPRRTRISVARFQKMVETGVVTPEDRIGVGEMLV